MKISMKHFSLLVLITLAYSCASPQKEVPQETEQESTPITYDWASIPVPANAGEGMTWELQSEVSDDFNYTATPEGKSPEFNSKWYDSYHNQWKGPGLTAWTPEQVSVDNKHLIIESNRKPGTDKVSTGCITSKTRVQYPVFIEAKAKLNKLVLASDVWLLSPDDTQEIDILEAYGSTRQDNQWYSERLHLSHHVFVREPLQDYQPTDKGSWYYEGVRNWIDDWVTIGVYWIDPWNLEYYVNGKLVRTVTGQDTIDPKNFTEGTGLSKEMDIIINVEDQTWRSTPVQGSPQLIATDEELADDNLNKMYVDWIRVYKPIQQ
ncbi:family 16 glycosylhydrolase [Flammeovirgaceae bacterium SG7u.111]|nr:family 16 glycosylhydrolase [Flammeovirgaceae bacterium SG7u.132]WPO37251.1 family 16 glycosylhydrolase [Flammeovirgaceae bacterium SG7u.111]